MGDGVIDGRTVFLKAGELSVFITRAMRHRVKKSASFVLLLGPKAPSHKMGFVFFFRVADFAL